MILNSITKLQSNNLSYYTVHHHQTNMDVTWRTIVAIGLISVLVTSYEYEYDSNYEIPADCRSCDKVKCPILVYCAGIKMRDRCGCCEWCSSDLFQPHAAPRAFPVSGTSLQAQPQVEPGNVLKTFISLLLR